VVSKTLDPRVRHGSRSTPLWFHREILVLWLAEFVRDEIVRVSTSSCNSTLGWWNSRRDHHGSGKQSQTISPDPVHVGCDGGKEGGDPLGEDAGAIQERVNSLFSKLEAQDESQHQMSAQLNITTQAFVQFSKDHVALMQQMATTNDLVARLVVGQQSEAALGTLGARATYATGH
jgi:hypothetical protein